MTKPYLFEKWLKKGLKFIWVLPIFLLAIDVGTFMGRIALIVKEFGIKAIADYLITYPGELTRLTAKIIILIAISWALKVVFAEE